MKDLAHHALNRAQLLGAHYADVRIVHRCYESIVVRDGHVSGLSRDESQGVGVRVLFDGAWGFASGSGLDLEAIAKVAEQAVAIAKASRLAQREKAILGPPVAHQGRYETPIAKDPFAVPLEEKIAVLLRADEAMRRVKGLRTAESTFGCQRETKLFASTEGAFIEQVLTETGGGIEAVAVGDGEVQKRSYPNSFGRHQAARGYELFEEMDLPGNGQKIAEEAVALLSAVQCPRGVTTLVLDPTQLALQVHESIGHAIELDRVFGMEADYAGTSFLDPAMRERFRYGSEIVNVTADATCPGGLGTFGYDDEGVPAQSSPIIRNGVFQGFLSSRETAAKLGTTSSGTMRADGWQRMPIIRMTNINLEPGDKTFEALIGEVDEGVFMQTNKSWSIDDKRLNFQFGCEIAWEIKNGKLGRMLKNPTYTGITPQFWAGCDGIGDASLWQLWGTPNCGKGQPGQTAHVGHGSAPARFRNVQVGIL